MAIKPNSEDFRPLILIAASVMLCLVIMYVSVRHALYMSEMHISSKDEIKKMIEQGVEQNIQIQSAQVIYKPGKFCIIELDENMTDEKVRSLVATCIFAHSKSIEHQQQISEQK